MMNLKIDKVQTEMNFHENNSRFSTQIKFNLLELLLLILALVIP